MSSNPGCDRYKRVANKRGDLIIINDLFQMAVPRSF